MKGGVVLSLGVLRALAGRPDAFAEAALLLVCDEEWRTAPFTHAERFAGWDACLCFEAGERTEDGDEGVVVRRKGAGTLHVTAEGVASHSGSDPDAGELFCDLRADDATAFDDVLGGLPAEHAGVALEASLLRVWPGMDASE